MPARLAAAVWHPVDDLAQRVTRLLGEGGSTACRVSKLLAPSDNALLSQLLRLAFRQLADLDFVRAGRLEGSLFTLDLLTREPLLQRGLVSEDPSCFEGA